MVYVVVWPAACVPAESEGGCEETVTVGELTDVALTLVETLKVKLAVGSAVVTAGGAVPPALKRNCDRRPGCNRGTG